MQPHPFAIHRTSTNRKGTYLPSLNQCTEGKGVPMTRHSRVTSWLSTAAISLEELVLVIVGGTEIDISS